MENFGKDVMDIVNGAIKKAQNSHKTSKFDTGEISLIYHFTAFRLEWLLSKGDNSPLNDGSFRSIAIHEFAIDGPSGKTFESIAKKLQIPINENNMISTMLLSLYLQKIQRITKNANVFQIRMLGFIDKKKHPEVPADRLRVAIDDIVVGIFFRSGLKQNFNYGNRFDLVGFLKDDSITPPVDHFPPGIVMAFQDCDDKVLYSFHNTQTNYTSICNAEELTGEFLSYTRLK